MTMMMMMMMMMMTTTTTIINYYYKRADRKRQPTVSDKRRILCIDVETPHPLQHAAHNTPHLMQQCTKVPLFSAQNGTKKNARVLSCSSLSVTSPVLFTCYVTGTARH